MKANTSSYDAVDKCSPKQQICDNASISFMVRKNWACHATDGPPKIGPPGPSAANYVAVDGPPGPSMAAMDGPPGPSVAP